MANEVRLIDANALNKRFDEKEADDIELYGVHIADCFPSDEAKEIVDQMPTIDPESLRPKGRWEYHDCVCTGDGLTSLYACSECHGAIDEEVYDNLYNTHFCPNCGAKMTTGE